MNDRFDVQFPCDFERRRNQFHPNVIFQSSERDLSWLVMEGILVFAIPDFTYQLVAEPEDQVDLRVGAVERTGSIFARLRISPMLAWVPQRVKTCFEFNFPCLVFRRESRVLAL